MRTDCCGQLSYSSIDVDNLLHSSSLKLMPLVTVHCYILLYGFRSFIPKFINAIYKCKSISTVGAEQVSYETFHWVR